jgi:regulatory protein
MMAPNLRYHRPMGKSVPALQQRLHEAALLYLGRYEASVQSLRRLLKRRIERWARLEHWEIDDTAGQAVEAVIARLRAVQAVDDARFAESRSRALFRGGRSGRAIRAYLAARGIDQDIAGRALAQRAGEEGDEDPDLTAALLLARKRRLGRFRPEEARADHRDRDLSALGRAGFSWEVARRVVDEES